jgi:hypothetical protein
VTLEDGTITKSVLNVRKKQNAGELKIINGFMSDDGSVQTDNQEVGVSVTLNWKEGGEHDIDI